MIAFAATLFFVIGGLQLLLGFNWRRFVGAGVITALLGPLAQCILLRGGLEIAKMGSTVPSWLIVVLAILLIGYGYASFSRRSKALGLEREPTTSKKRRIELD